MDYIVRGLPLAPFQPLFGLEDAALHARGIVRMTADRTPGFPCRVTLADAEPGGEHHRSHLRPSRRCRRMR